MLGSPVGTIIVSGSNSSGWLQTTTNTTDQRTVHLPMRVFHVTLLSWGTAASVLQLSNGSSAATPQLVVGGSAARYILNSQLQQLEVDIDYGVWGQSFTNGVYYACDGNIISAAIACRADLF